MSGFHKTVIVPASPSRYEIRTANAQDKVLLEVQFQDGPTRTYGINGVLIEDLLNVCLQQLHLFQQGPYKTAYNARAIAHIAHALEELDARTARRLEQGIEGTSQVGIE
jgi:hypothetical protein